MTAAGGLLAALGGWEAVRYLLNRKTERRKAAAAAADMELDTLRRQYDWLQAKYDELNRKVDSLYGELHAVERRNNELERRNNELEVALRIAEYNVCERPDGDCSRRIPPRRGASGFITGARKGGGDAEKGD